MKIDLFAICYNEELILPYFLRHYSQFCDNITIYDNYSTDKSEEIAVNAGAKVVKFDTNNEFREDLQMQVRSNCWKSSDADWVIVCDCDEFVYHSNLIDVLEQTDSTIFYLKVFDMYSLMFPTTKGQIYEEVKMGYHNVNFGGTGVKPILFKPSEINEINYASGSHKAVPLGNVKANTVSDIKLLHMRYLSKEYVINRNAEYGKRHSEVNKRNGWTIQNLLPAIEHETLFNENIKKVEKIL